MSKRPRKYAWNAVRAFYEAGHSLSECQARFGFSNGAWHAAIDRGDINAEVSPRPRFRTRAAVERLLERGLSQAQIARELGISKPTVCLHVQFPFVLTLETFRRIAPPLDHAADRVQRWRRDSWYANETGGNDAEYKPSNSFAARHKRPLQMRPAEE